MTAPQDRRRFLLTACASTGLLLLPYAGTRPALATPADVALKIKEVTGDKLIRKGRVKLDLPILVESSNAVSMKVSVDEVLPPAARVQSIHVFAEANPLPNVVHFRFGPRSGKPVVSTRIRLATSQTVIAIAQCADGTCWRDEVELLVALAACLD